MVDNEIVWDSAVAVAEALERITEQLQEQNRILKAILEALCAK
jgi:hypothetical protein